ncbi:MAG TPA: ATP-binding protein [Nitrospiraceae bacterium]|nr:ATP-binding protein [Nitrospiraceae bacterium]
MRTLVAVDRFHFLSSDRWYGKFIRSCLLINLFTDPFRRISLLVISLIISAGVIGFLILQYVESAFVQRAGQTLELAAADAADKLDRLMFERYGDIQMMAHAFASEIDNPAFVSTYLSRVRQAYPLYMWLAVTDAQGKIIASTDSIWVGQVRTTTNWFQTVRAQRGILIQEVQAYAETGGLQAVSFSAPLIDTDGTFRGVVTSLLGLPVLADLFQQAQHVFRMQVGPLTQPEYLVVAKNGQTIIEFLSHEQTVADLSPLTSVGRLRGSDFPGYVEEWTLRDHRKVITGYARTKGYRAFTGLSWGVLVRVDKEAVLGPITKITRKIALAGLAIVLPALALLFWTTLRLQKEHRKLRESEEALRRAQLELEKRVQERTEELEAKQAQLVQSAKLASLGELASGIAHELNNPLNNIGLFAGNAEQYVASGQGDTGPLRECLHHIQEQVRRAASIIRHIRTFARTAPLTHEEVSINEVLRQSVSLMVEELRLHNITVVFHLDETQPLVLGNTIQLEQIFVNLLTNARDAMQGLVNRVITITTYMVNDKTVGVEIADTGSGIPASVMPRIFDPFFTTKAVGQGTGLGLSITYGIVKEHRGTIEARSDEGTGTIFILQFPISTLPVESNVG